MKIRHKILRLIALVMFATLLFTACTKSNTSKTNNNASVTLTIWTEGNRDALDIAIAEYQTLHPDIAFDVQERSKPSPTDVMTAFINDASVDLINMDQVYNVSLGIDGYFEDLNAYGAAEIKDQFLKSTIDSLSVGDKLYGLPFDANTICLFYNKDIFEACDAKPPTTLDELKLAALKIRKRKGGEYDAYTMPFFDTNNKNWSAFNYMFYLWRMGGDILTDDLKSAAFNSEAGVEALDAILSLVNGGVVAKKYKEGEFIDGKVGMMENGSWQMTNLFGGGKRANFGILPMVQLKEGVTGYSGLGLSSYAIPTMSKHKQEAYDFLKFYCTGTAYQLTFCRGSNMIPTLKSAHKDAYYASEEWQVLIKQLENSKYRPGVKNWDQIEQTIADAVYRAVTGEATSKEALDDAAQTINRLLNEQNKA